MLGVITGLLIQSFPPAETGKAISGAVFIPIYTVFINALKMIVGPLVFFSIAASISEFSDLNALGRLAGRNIMMYVITSMAIYQLMVDIYKFPKHFCTGLLMALA